MTEEYDTLKLENQNCFLLYACAKEIVKKYKPYLEDLDLTYTQFITMMVLWQNKEMNVKELGDFLYLDSGTLTPLLKKLEQKGYISRRKDKNDERVLHVTLTPSGNVLKENAVDIPSKICDCIKLEDEEKHTLTGILKKILEVL